jgi:murein DD-endopeptidase MepM/ murein hydrolase activator NlpD
MSEGNNPNGQESAPAPDPSDSYEVGYGKPPKATRFGARAQPARSQRWNSTNQATDIAALLDRPISVALNGKKTKMHPHEAMMLGLGKRLAATAPT